MPNDPKSKPSFSPYRRWGMALQMVVLVLLVLSVTAMVNYVSHGHFHRFHFSDATKLPLSARTIKFLQSLTNQVNITLFYDKDEPMFSTVSDLVNEYKLACPKISVRLVDYTRDPGAAQELKAKYSFLASPNAKNVVLFESQGRVKPVDGKALAQYVIEQVPNDKDLEFRRKPTAFEGERAFTSTIAAVVNPNPLKAYFLRGHGEHEFDSGDESVGYQKFATILRENYMTNSPLFLLSTNAVPADCNLLIIAGPVAPLEPSELDKIEQYLNQGGRLFVLFNVLSLDKGDTGLEKVLAKWGIQVTASVIQDPEQTSGRGDVVVHNFSTHPIVNPLIQSAIHVILPRLIGKVHNPAPAADAPRVDELAFSTPKSYIKGQEDRGTRAFPLAVASEKAAVKDVVSARGSTRIVVIGDSLFLGNHQIESLSNRDFAWNAVNWLLDRTQLMEIGPRPVKEYRIVMSRVQAQRAQWVLLGGMPGVILLCGGMVWLRRRR